MDIVHKDTGKTQTISKQDWAKLVDTKHSANFTVTNENDFTPPELTIPGAKSDKPK